MGQWKVSSLIARDSESGKWVVLDGPRLNGYSEQRDQLIKMTNSRGKIKGKGKEKDKQYDLACIQDGYGKRRKFNVVEKETVTNKKSMTKKIMKAVKKTVKAAKKNRKGSVAKKTQTIKTVTAADIQS